MDDVKAKQQIVEKINASTNILVTVSNNPSVDALSAALGLTLLLDKLEKHATAIFSGTVPPAIAFLQPEKTFDDTTDSLRDFIIALNKDKADHLRYKIDGDLVKIFITPYKTTITGDDLQFSQGDFNVELVIALGVDNSEHLDGALEAHGQILHDATIITVTAGEQTSTLGGIDWHQGDVSSLSEMIAGLGEALKTDKTKSLLDPQISTALLTGIVAQTDRFSNTHTTSQVMSVAAQLMTAGADQQLIAVKLQESHDISTPTAPAASAAATPSPVESDQPTISITHDEPAPVTSGVTPVAPAVDIPAPGALSSAYALDEPVLDSPVAPAEPVAPTPAPVADVTPIPATPPTVPVVPAVPEAPEPSHAYLDTQQSFDTSVNGTATAPSPGDQPVGEILDHSQPSQAPTEPAAMAAPLSAYAPEPDLTSPVTPEPVPAPAAPATPASLGLPLPPPVPDFSSPSALPSLPPQQTPPPELLGDILSPEPIASALPPIDVTPPQPPAGTSPTDPGQFRIPGQ